MIVYGIRAKVLTTENVTEACPNCNSHTVHISVVQKWAHIFWIPTFPAGKTGVSQCTNCKQVLKLKEMPASLRLAYDNIKAQTSTPLWTFSGVVVIAALFAFAYFHGKQNAERVTKMIPALQKGDIIHLKTTDGNYTLAKVTRVSHDTVVFVNNKLQTNQESDLENLKTKEYDTKERFFTVADLQAMDKKEEIVDIDRE